MHPQVNVQAAHPARTPVSRYPIIDERTRYAQKLIVTFGFPRLRTRIVRVAALALCSLSLKCHANKTRCAALDAVPILLELGSAWGVAEEGKQYIVSLRTRAAGGEIKTCVNKTGYKQ